jgi:cobalt/nickel transport system ATP-binding protein
MRGLVMDAVNTINLSYIYSDGTKALKNVNFNVKIGECVALLGPNGAGKSTLLEHFNGLLTPTSGEVLIKGKPVTKKNIEKIRTLVGMLFQNPEDQLFAMTVWQDIAYGPKNLKLAEEEIKRRVEESLRLVRMQGFEDKAINHLSYGEKKRIAIAGILAMHPEILALDEPTSGLDPKMASDMIGLFLRLKEDLKVTLIIATHDVDAVPLFADRIYVLNKGSVQLEGTPKEVFADKAEIRKSCLRLPRIAHLFEILKKDELPLTIGQARKALEDKR